MHSKLYMKKVKYSLKLISKIFLKYSYFTSMKNSFLLQNSDENKIELHFELVSHLPRL